MLKMYCLEILTCVGLILLVYPDLVYGIEARAACRATTTQDHEFQFTFRFARGANTSFTGLAFYNSSETSLTMGTAVISEPAECTDTTLDSNDVFEVGFSVDGDASTLPCGIIKDSNVYTITTVALGDINEAYRFNCTTGSSGNILPEDVDIATFETGNIVDKAVYRPNKQSLRFDVFHADGNRVPSITARSGELLQLRVGYNKDASEGADSWGRTFHVVFLQHGSAEISLQVVTRDLGSLIKVTGDLPGSTFEDYYPVKRDVEMVIFIRDEYRHVDQANAWNTTKRAVKVEVIKGGDVAVRALSRKRGSTTRRPAGLYLSIPDDALGTKYNCYTGSTEAGGQALVYVIEDSTDVTVSFNSFTLGLIQINGVQVTADTTITMDENEVLYIQCGTECGVITVEADKPIGVVTGHEDAKIDPGDTLSDHLVSQMPPVHTYSKNFKVINLGRFRIYTEDPTALVNYTTRTGLVENVASGTLVEPLIREEVTFSQNVLLLLTQNTGGRSATRPWPSFEQWATRYYLFLVPDATYTLAVIAAIGDIANIQFLDTGGVTNIGSTTIGDVSSITIANIRVPSGETERFERTRNIDVNLLSGKGPAMIEIRSADKTRPFLLDIKETNPGLRSAQLPVTGIRFPTINPCVPSPDVETTFGAVNHSIPGDMQDNDCNGEIDEDIDDTNSPGSDLAALPISPYVGIYVDFLQVSNLPAFPTDGSGRTYTLISGGCSTSLGTALSVGPFKWNRGIGEQFDTFHVMDTEPFRAFSLGTQIVYFRVRVGFCYGNLTSTKCDNSCQTTTRRRRQADDDTIELGTQLNIEGPVDETKFMEPDGVCPMNKLYWIPAILLFLTILVEAIVNGVLIGLRVQLSDWIIRVYGHEANAKK